MNLNRQEPSSAQHAPLNPGPAAQAVQVPKRDVPVGESGSSNSNNVTNPVGVAGLKPLASVCSPLGEGVSQVLREKIGRGEFVDLGLLLQNWGEYTDPEQLARNVQLSLDSGGHPVFKPIVPKAKIDSLAKWTSAFLVYSSIFIDFHPQRAQEMLKYIQIIRSAAIRFGRIGWRLYDSHFRMRQQRNPQNLWSTIDSELWFLFVVSNSSRRGLATPQLQAQRFQAASAGKAPAYNFSQRAQVFPAQSQQRATGGGGWENLPGSFSKERQCVLISTAQRVAIERCVNLLTNAQNVGGKTMAQHRVGASQAFKVRRGESPKSNSLCHDPYSGQFAYLIG